MSLIHDPYSQFALTHLRTYIHIPFQIPSLSNAKGIYLREAEEACRGFSGSVQVKPVFHRDSPKAMQLDFEKKYSLTASKDWIECPQALLLASQPRTFPLTVDTQQLAPGEIHSGQVLGLDVEDLQAGPVFRVPVHVITPLPLAMQRGQRPSLLLHPQEKPLEFTPGHLERCAF